MPRLRLLFPTLLLLAALPGCGRDLEPRGDGGSTIDPETFIRVIEALSTVRAATHPDTALYARRRAEILASHRVTEADLIRFTEVHGRNDELLAPIYQRVGARLDSLMQERARRMGETAAPVPAGMPDRRESFQDPPPDATTPEVEPAVEPDATADGPPADTTPDPPPETLPDD